MGKILSPMGHSCFANVYENADINLAEDTFHRTFSDSIPIASDVTALPDMQGSGRVRDLQEAASIDNTAGNALQAQLAAYATANRSGQLAGLDSLLLAWANTSDLIGTMQQRNPAQFNVVWANSAQQAEWESKLHILEAFNGRYFFVLPGETGTGAVTGISIGAPDGQGIRTVTLNLAAEQLQLLQQSYDALKQSVYDSLVLQTRFQPLLDRIELVIDAQGITLDFAPLQTEWAERLNGAANDEVMQWVA